MYLLTAMNLRVQKQCFCFFPKVWREYAKRSLFEVWFPFAATGAGGMKENNEEIAANSLHVQTPAIY